MKEEKKSNLIKNTINQIIIGAIIGLKFIRQIIPKKV